MSYWITYHFAKERMRELSDAQAHALMMRRYRRRGHTRRLVAQTLRSASSALGTAAGRLDP